MFVQGFNPMGMSGMMGGYGYGYGNGANFYQGFGGCYPNMNGYHYNQYGMPSGESAVPPYSQLSSAQVSGAARHCSWRLLMANLNGACLA